MTLRTTEAGTVIINDHPEERRKLQEADDVFMGMTVARVTSGSRAPGARLAVRRRRRQDRPGHGRPGGAGRPPRSPFHRDGARHLAGGPLARAIPGPSAGCSP